MSTRRIVAPPSRSRGTSRKPPDTLYAPEFQASGLAALDPKPVAFANSSAFVTAPLMVGGRASIPKPAIDAASVVVEPPGSASDVPPVSAMARSRDSALNAANPAPAAPAPKNARRDEAEFSIDTPTPDADLAPSIDTSVERPREQPAHG